MIIFTIQSKSLDTSRDVFAKIKCNYQEAKYAYEKIYDDYNKKFNSRYKSLFWGFTKILPFKSICDDDFPYHLNKDPLKKLTKTTFSVLNKTTKNNDVLILDVPDTFCMKTNFYTFNDVIIDKTHDDPIAWNEIYNINGVTQVLFPFIIPSMVIYRFSPLQFENTTNWSDTLETQVRESIGCFFY